MKIVLENTDKIVDLFSPHAGMGGPCVLARIWEGVMLVDGREVPVHCYVARIAVEEGRPAEDYALFERELIVCRKPTPAVAAIPPRLVL